MLVQECASLRVRMRLPNLFHNATFTLSVIVDPAIFKDDRVPALLPIRNLFNLPHASPASAQCICPNVREHLHRPEYLFRSVAAIAHSNVVAWLWRVPLPIRRATCVGHQDYCRIPSKLLFASICKRQDDAHKRFVFLLACQPYLALNFIAQLTLIKLKDFVTTRSARLPYHIRIFVSSMVIP